MNEWRPHPKQAQALERPEFEILYGGARGGGKTDAGLVWLIGMEDDPEKPLLLNPRYRALVIRKNAEDLADWIDRAYRFYRDFGVDIAYKPAVLRFPGGAVIRTGHLKDDQSYTKYMGQEFPRMLIEELNQIPFEKRYLQLIASCRSSIPEIKPQIFMTTNPGGLGHGWVKRRFVDPSTPGIPFKDKISGRSRIYIPATVDDNPTLMSVDPDYVKSLDALKDTDIDLWKAWRLGDWNTFAGQFFREFRPDLHTCKPFIPTKDKYVFVGGMDWGRTAPFSFHLSAIEVINIEGVKFNRSYTFLEVYGTDKTPKEWAEEIKKKLTFFNLTLDDIAWIRGDPAMFTKQQDNSISIADQFRNEDVIIKPASNDRIGGWEVLHNWLSIALDGKPYWIITESCPNLIRTLPELIHDETRVEDVDTNGEDHASDDQRYEKKHIKWVDSKLGKIGGYKKDDPSPTAIMKDGKQVSVDIGKFGDAAVKFARNHK